MTWETAFMAANAAALWGWLILIFWPQRTGWPLMVAGRIIPIGVSLAYCLVIVLAMPTVEGGYMSLAGVRQLAGNDAVLVAGWMHVIAFDLFVGAWSASKMDERAVSRVVQAPVLLAIFMAGPFGFLIAMAAVAWVRVRPPAGSA